MTFTAFPSNSLALGGRAFDAVVLQTFSRPGSSSTSPRSSRRSGSPRPPPALPDVAWTRSWATSRSAVRG